VLIRAQVKSVREARLRQTGAGAGARNGRLWGKQHATQVAPLLDRQPLCLMVALAIFAETYITFLGSAIQPALVGSADRERLQGRRGAERAWGRSSPPGRVRDTGDPGLHDDRPVDGGRTQPTAQGRAPLGAPIPAAACVDTGQRVSPPPVLAVEDLHVWFGLEHG